jgi:hypothetical protein
VIIPVMEGSWPVHGGAGLSWSSTGRAWLLSTGPELLTFALLAVATGALWAAKVNAYDGGREGGGRNATQPGRARLALDAGDGVNDVRASDYGLDSIVDSFRGRQLDGYRH